MQLKKITTLFYKRTNFSTPESKKMYLSIRKSYWVSILLEILEYYWFVFRFRHVTGVAFNLPIELTENKSIILQPIDNLMILPKC